MDKHTDPNELAVNVDLDLKPVEWYTISNRQPISAAEFLAHFRNLPKSFTIVNEDGDTFTVRLTRLDPDTPTTD